VPGTAKGKVVMPKEIVEIPVFSEMIRKLNMPLSPVVRANGFLFVSGLPPFDPKTGKLMPGDIEAQTEGSILAIKHALESAGSSLDKVVKATVYAVNAGYFNAINRVYAKYFGKSPPARTFVAVGSWPMEFDIEIECIAVA
jgi:2-iminobutanoate/2-iminopropanoate deaminase